MTTSKKQNLTIELDYKAWPCLAIEFDNEE